MRGAPEERVYFRDSRHLRASEGVGSMAGDHSDSEEVIYGAASHGVDELEEGRLGAHSVVERRASGARRRMAVAAAGAGAAVLLLTIATTALQVRQARPFDASQTFFSSFLFHHSRCSLPHSPPSPSKPAANCPPTILSFFLKHSSATAPRSSIVVACVISRERI